MGFLWTPNLGIRARNRGKVSICIYWGGERIMNARTRWTRRGTWMCSITTGRIKCWVMKVLQSVWWIIKCDTKWKKNYQLETPSSFMKRRCVFIVKTKGRRKCSRWLKNSIAPNEDIIFLAIADTEINMSFYTISLKLHGHRDTRAEQRNIIDWSAVRFLIRFCSFLMPIRKCWRFSLQFAILFGPLSSHKHKFSPIHTLTNLHT